MDTTTPASSLASLSGADALASKKPSKLHDAAQQFEALMIGEMMKSARGDDSEGWMGSGGGPGDDTAMDMAQSQFAHSLAMSGGLGLTKMVEKSVGDESTARQNHNAVPGASSGSKP